MGLEGAVQCAILVMYEFIRNKAFVHSFTNSLIQHSTYLLSISDVPGIGLGVGTQG